MRSPSSRIPEYAPYAPPRIDSNIVYAVKGFAVGEATKEQQQIIMNWLLMDVCKRGDLPWFPGPDGDRDTSFANGKLFVALQILKAYNMPADKVAEMREREIAQSAGNKQEDEHGRRD